MEFLNKASKENKRTFKKTFLNYFLELVLIHTFLLVKNRLNKVFIKMEHFLLYNVNQNRWMEKKTNILYPNWYYLAHEYLSKSRNIFSTLFTPSHLPTSDLNFKTWINHGSRNNKNELIFLYNNIYSNWN